MRREENHPTKRMSKCKICRYKSKGRPKTKWMNCVKDDSTSMKLEHKKYFHCLVTSWSSTFINSKLFPACQWRTSLMIETLLLRDNIQIWTGRSISFKSTTSRVSLYATLLTASEVHSVFYFATSIVSLTYYWMSCYYGA